MQRRRPREANTAGDSISKNLVNLGGHSTLIGCYCHVSVSPLRHRGCKLKTQKITPGIEGTRIFSTNDLFEKVSDRNPRESRTLMRPGAARHALFPSGQLETDRSIS